MDTKLAQAFFLKDWTVYGYRLKPFCLLHRLKLEAIKSPLVCGGEIRPFDILIAAQICACHSTRFDPFRRHFFRRLFQSQEKQLAIFFTYMDECRSRPDLQSHGSEQGGASPWNAPAPLLIATTLITHSSITEARAWTMPEGLAMWYFYSIREQEAGKSEIYTEEMQEDDAALKLQNEIDAPQNKRRSLNLALKHRELWPEGVAWDIDAELPPEAYAQLEEDE